MSVNTGTIPLTVEFSGHVSGGHGPYTFQWHFGDGESSNLQNPVHMYESAGSFTVALDVVDARSEAGQAKTVIVAAPPVAPDLTITSFQAQVFQFNDDFEPNDTAPHNLGNAPLDMTLEGYIDPRSLQADVEITNTGTVVDKAFFVDLYLYAAAAPVPGEEGQAFETIEALAPGQSVVVPLDIANVPVGDYTPWALVDTMNDVSEASEANNTADHGTLQVAADVDTFRFFQDSGFSISIDLDSLPADYDIELRRADGTLVAFSDNAGTTAESLSVASAPASDFYDIVIIGFDGANNGETPYQLRVNLQ
jgi:PKD repeat protein